VTLPPLCLLATLSVLALTGCNRAGHDHPDWIIDSQLVFLSDDFSRERPPLAAGDFRLVFPYIAGDIHGSATTGDFINPVLAPDYRLHIDLNRAHPALLKSLEPTSFSASYLHIEPPEARVARLAPIMLQADGIEQVGRIDWFDPDAKRTLLLLYLDRPARIFGRGSSRGRPLRYAIEAPAAGYVWVGQQSAGDEDVYAATPRPARLVLAARPPIEELRTGPFPVGDPLPE
jgi:hypothetical protein